MPRPDVSLISPYPAIGATHGGSSGVASYSANLARSLAEAGARVEVIAPRSPGQAAVAERDGSVLVRRGFRASGAGVMTAMRDALRTGAPIVHLQHEFFLYGGPATAAGLVAGLGAARTRHRHAIVTLHQVVDPSTVDRDFTRLHRVQIPAWTASRGLAAVQGALGRVADRAIVHEPAFADLVPGAVVVPHGIEPAGGLDRGLARRKLGVPDGEFCVLCFGFLAPYKGLETALDAVRDAGAPLRATVAGGEHPRLSRRGDVYGDALRATYGERARFTGWVAEDDVSAWFVAADLALFMYPRPFSSSGALALALAHGTPLLVSPQLSRTAGLDPGLTAPAEPTALAARLRQLAADRVGVARLGELSRAAGRARGWSAVARRHLSLYTETEDAGRDRRR